MEAQGDSATSKFNSLHIKVSAAAFCPTVVIQTTCSERFFIVTLCFLTQVLGLRKSQKLHYWLLRWSLRKCAPICNKKSKYLWPVTPKNGIVRFICMSMRNRLGDVLSSCGYCSFFPKWTQRVKFSWRDLSFPIKGLFKTGWCSTANMSASSILDSFPSKVRTVKTAVIGIHWKMI